MPRKTPAAYVLTPEQMKLVKRTLRKLNRTAYREMNSDEVIYQAQILSDLALATLAEAKRNR